MNEGVDQKEPKLLTNFEAYTLLVKSVLGFGTLTVPLAFVSVGLIGGIFFTIVFSLLLVNGAYILAKCMAEVRSRKGDEESMTISQAITYAFTEGPSCCKGFSKVAGVFADILLILTHYGLNIVYIIFIAENFTSVIHEFEDTLHLRISIAIAGICTLPIFLLREFRWLYTISLISNIAIYMCFACIISELSISNYFPDLILAHTDFMYLPLFLGFIMFCVSSVGVVAIVEPKMDQPEQFFGFKGVFSTSAILIFTTNLCVGITAYCFMGDDMLVRFLENLAEHQEGALAVKLAMSVAVYCSIPLNGYVPVDIILKRCLSKDREPSSVVKIDYILRTVFVVLSTLNAAAVPVMMPFLKVFGSFYLAFLNLIFPACMELCLMYNEANGKSKCMLFKDIVIIFMGILVFLVGLYCAVFDIMAEYAGMKIMKNKWTKLHEFVD